VHACEKFECAHACTECHLQVVEELEELGKINPFEIPPFFGECINKSADPAHTNELSDLGRDYPFEIPPFFGKSLGGWPVT